MLRSPPTRSSRRSTTRLFDYRLTDPRNSSFVGLGNYSVILTDSVWWTSFGVTVVITVVTVAVELVLGFGLAMVMLNALRGLRPHPAHGILIPYAVITVVSASPGSSPSASDTGFVNSWFSWLPGVTATTDWFGSAGHLAVRDLPVGDLEDHAVHLAAAAGGSGPGARGAAGGGQGRRRDVRGSASGG